jgi:hypothetical protein
MTCVKCGHVMEPESPERWLPASAGACGSAGSCSKCSHCGRVVLSGSSRRSYHAAPTHTVADVGS